MAIRKTVEDYRAHRRAVLSRRLSSTLSVVLLAGVGWAVWVSGLVGRAVEAVAERDRTVVVEVDGSPDVATATDLTAGGLQGEAGEGSGIAEAATGPVGLGSGGPLVDLVDGEVRHAAFFDLSDLSARQLTWRVGSGEALVDVSGPGSDSVRLLVDGLPVGRTPAVVEVSRRMSVEVRPETTATQGMVLVEVVAPAVDVAP